MTGKIHTLHKHSRPSRSRNLCRNLAQITVRTYVQNKKPWLLRHTPASKHCEIVSKSSSGSIPAIPIVSVATRKNTEHELTRTPHRLAHAKELFVTGTSNNEAVGIHVWNERGAEEIACEKVGLVVLRIHLLRFWEPSVKIVPLTSVNPAMTGSMK